MIVLRLALILWIFVYIIHLCLAVFQTRAYHNVRYVFLKTKLLLNYRFLLNSLGLHSSVVVHASC